MDEIDCCERPDLEWMIDLLRQATCQPPPWEEDRVVKMLRDQGYDMPSHVER